MQPSTTGNPSSRQRVATEEPFVSQGASGTEAFSTDAASSAHESVGNEPSSRESMRGAKGKGPSLVRKLNIADILVFFVGVVLGRTHLAFGAYPFGIAFLSCLPHHVFIGLAGAVAGALSRGRSGILFAMISFIALFVRIIISGAEKHSEDGTMFKENLTLRMSAGTIGGFVSAVYELLLRGITLESVLFSITMIFGVALSTVAFGLLFSYPLTLRGVLFHSTGLRARESDGKMRRKKYLFLFSAICYLIALSYGLSGIELVGVSLGGIFVFFVTLLIAKRFGAVHGAVVGFLGGLVIAPEFAVACAVGGAVSGLLFPFGNLWGEVSVVLLGALWGLYTDNLVGLLSLLPEGAIGTMLAHPLLAKVKAESAPEVQERNADEERALDMVRTVSARIIQENESARERVADALLRLSALLHKEEGEGSSPTEREYRALLEGAMNTRCKTCTHFDSCVRQESGFYRSAPSMLSLLLSHRAPVVTDVGVCEDETRRDEFVGALCASVGRMEEDAYKKAKETPIGEVIHTVGEMVREGGYSARSEGQENAELSERLTEVMHKFGFPEGCARVIGTRRMRVLICGADEDGTRITSGELHRELEASLGKGRLGAPSYFRQERFVLANFGARRRFRMKCASAVLSLSDDGISGDVVETFEGGDGVFYGLISDGTGSGAEARESARFAVDFLRATVNSGAEMGTSLRLLDEIMRRRAPEQSATLDLFSLDLLSGEGAFYKLGAVSSFIKRADSLFSIRAHTLPLGLSDGAFLGERISAGIGAGDIVVLISDGVSQDPDHAPWLLERLAHTTLLDPRAIAEDILLLAKREHGKKDDMSILVCRVEVEE